MIRKTALLLVAAIAIGFFTSILFKQSDNFASDRQASQAAENIQVGAGDDLTLDFTGARVTVKGWDKNYVQVLYWFGPGESQDVSPDGKKLKITRDGKSILITSDTHIPMVYNLQTWLPLVQFDKYRHQADNMKGIGIGMSTMSTEFDYRILVPRNTPVSINAAEIEVSDCNVNYINGVYQGK